MLNNSVRSTKGMAILVGAIFFVAAFVGLVYNHLDSWNLPVRYTCFIVLLVPRPTDLRLS